jgi:uncharacterized membrane protein
MRFVALQWLLLVPALVVLGWLRPGLRLHRPLRVLCLALLMLILVEPQVRQLGRGLDLWVLVDRSASAADAMARQLVEWQSLLERTKSVDDRIFYVDFADVPVLRGEGTANYSGDIQQTRTRLALQYALSLMNPDRASRVLALTDGFSTEPLPGVAERLAAQQVSLDYRLVRSPDVSDYEIAALRLPSRAQPGEPFLVEVEIAGNPDAALGLEITRDGKPLTRQTVEVRGGRGRIRFTDQILEGGAHNYTVRLAGNDARSGNDVASQWIEIHGGPRILLVTGYRGDPVALALRAQGFDLQVIEDASRLDVGMLSGAKTVILNNVPAYKLPPDFLAALDFFVRVQGGGLLMAGGKFSFGSGGYFGSPIADLLPVSMELRADQRKLAVAMAIVMDRSGSMAAPVASGVAKMDLANEGAARAIELLGGSDAVSVHAVDSESHAVIPLTQLGANRAQLVDTVRRVTSGGGGIFVYQGLKAGWEELKKAQAGQRHLILFADAADAEEPGDYQKLLDEMTRAGATVSVIGLGRDTDSDAEFLKDVAARGKGRIFFNADANTLPALFEQETVAVARSAFIDEPVGLQSTSGWLEIAAKLPKWPAEVDGYNLSYLKPEATAAALAKDEYAAPLVAFWQRGAGRSAAVSFPLGGEFSARVRAWPEYGDFLQTLVRWSGGEALPPGIGLRTKVEGNELSLDLLFDETWEDRLARDAPEVVIAEGASGKARALTWQRLRPGHFQARVPLAPGSWIRGAVRAGAHTLSFGPVTAATNPEWTLNRERVNELEAVSRLSGGVERLDLSGVWSAPRREEYRDLRAWLLVSLLVVFLADVLVTRIGWHLPELALPKIRFRARRERKPLVPKPKAPALPAEEKPSSPAPPREETRGSRFRRAKRGGG